MAKSNTSNAMDKLLEQDSITLIPKIGDMIGGQVISASANEVLIDIDGIGTGIVRGREVHDESGEYSNIEIGDVVSATLVEFENEQGQFELSFRVAGHQKAWDQLQNLRDSNDIIDVIVLDANKGGLIVRIGNVMGFLPVSQLSTENYPRVEGGDKAKILIKLKSFIGNTMRAKVIDVREEDGKVIASEKAAWEEEHREALGEYTIGQEVSGKVTGIVDFGLFVEFSPGLEGLVHISEIAWQRIDNPREAYEVGDDVSAKIIAIKDGKISLSIKSTQRDPWATVGENYNLGDKVKCKVLKLNPFGAFVELDKDIHGLCHISELSDKGVKEATKTVEIGSTYDFAIISMSPEEHRLGLSIKALSDEKRLEKIRKGIDTKEEETEEEEPKKETKKEPKKKD